MISEWDDVLFLTIPYKDSGVNILTQLDDTQMLLEEHIIKVEAMRGSAFVKLIEEEVKNFYFLLHRIHSTIEEWTKVFLEALSRQLSFLSFLHIVYILFLYIYFLYFIFFLGSSTMDVFITYLFKQRYRCAITGRRGIIFSSRQNIS